MTTLQAEKGYISEVDVEPLGSHLAVDHALGATTLQVDDAVDFDEDGGTVWIDGHTYSYTSADLELDTITLAAGLSSAELAGELVQVWDDVQGVGTVDMYALVVLPSAGQEDDPIRASVSHALAPMLSIGSRGGRGEAVTIESDGLSSWTVTDVEGLEPIINPSFLDPNGLPDPIPLDPPAASPTLTIKPTSVGFIVIATDIAPTSQIKYYVGTPGFSPGPTNLSTTTRSQVTEIRTLPDGSAFVPGTTYSFIAIATNVNGDAPASPETTAELKLIGSDQVDEMTVEKLSSGDLTAVIALLGSLQVGQITLDPDDGLKIPLANGGVISLPADGTAAQFLRVLLQATSLLVEDNFELRGVGSILSGLFTAVAGVGTPLVGATVTTGWDDPSVNASVSISTGSAKYGVVDDGISWVSCSPGDGRISGYNKSTGAETVLLNNPASRENKSVARIGTDFYVLAKVTSPVSYVVRKYDSTWTFQSEFAITSSSSVPPFAISSDGSTLYMAFMDLSTSKVHVDSMTTSGASRTTVFTSVDTFPGTPNWLYVGSADFGAQRFIIGQSSLLRIYSSSGARQTAQEWAAPNGSLRIGVYWDGTNLREMSYSGVWKLSPVATSTVRSVRWSKYDNMGTTHESAWSPAVAFTQAPRTWMRVSTPAPEDQGGVDDPKANRHYIQTGGAGSYWRQPDVTASPWTAYYGTPLGSGFSGVSSPDFSAVASPGMFRSAATRQSSIRVTLKQIVSNVATLTTATPHRFSVGSQVTVADVDATFNGTFTILSVPSPATFTYALVAGNTGPTAVTVGTAASPAPTILLSGDGSGNAGPYEWDSNGVPLNGPFVASTNDGGSYTTVATSPNTFLYPTGLPEAVFVAPKSGAVRISVRAYLQANATGNIVLMAPEVRAGATVRSGTVVYGANTLDGASNASTSIIRAGAEALITGLTPGATYNAYVGVYRATAGSLVNNSRMTISPIN